MESREESELPPGIRAFGGGSGGWIVTPAPRSRGHRVGAWVSEWEWEMALGPLGRREEGRESRGELGAAWTPGSEEGHLCVWTPGQVKGAGHESQGTCCGAGQR